MRRFFVLLLLVSLSAPGSSREKAHDNKDPHANHKNHSAKQQPRLTKDGATDPASIPTLVSYEFFLGSLVARPEDGERGQDRVRATIEKLGLSEAGTDALLYHAIQFKQLKDGFDKETMDIKDRTWPNPPKETWGQLRLIQARKEAAMDGFITSMLRRLGKNDSAAVAAHISKVARKVKGFADEPSIPGQRPRTAFNAPNYSKPGKSLPSNSMAGSFMGNSRTAPSSTTQMSHSIYAYADTVVSWDSLMVYGYGAVSDGSDSYGHVYTARIEMNGPVYGMYSTSGFMSLQFNGVYQDGFFSTRSTIEQYCPSANATYDAGYTDSGEAVAGYFVVKDFGSWANNPISKSGSTSIPISVSASQNASGNFNAEFGYSVQSGSVQHVVIGGSGNFTIVAGNTMSFNGHYGPANISAQSKIKATVAVTSAVTVYDHYKTSAQQLTINP